MNKDQFARLERHRKVKQRVSDWQAAVDAVPAFKEIADDYLAQLQRLDGTARKRPLVSQGATTDKQTAADALITRVVKAANALWLLYRKEKNGEAAGKLHRNPSDYRNMQDLDFATEALRVSAQLTARIADLSNYNLTAANAATFATDAKAYDDSLEKPQLAIDDQKIKGANAGATLSALNRYLKDDFRAGLELLKDTHPDAYQALREASQVDDPGYRKRRADAKNKFQRLATSAPAASFGAAARMGNATTTVTPADLSLKAAAGADVLVSLAVSPENTTTITQKIGGVAQAINAHAGFETVAQVPAVIKYRFRFNMRPWTASIAARADQDADQLSSSSKDLGLEDGPLVNPDIWDVTLTTESQ